MNEDVKSTSVHIHSRADELIACLEGEIAKRDARIVELQNDASYYAARNEELRAKLAAPVSDAKARGVVMPERDAVIRKAVGMCNRIPGSTTWNAAEFAYDELAARLAAAPAAPAADAVLVEALGYQVLFDAIAAATSVYANGAINISVQAFRAAIAAHRAKGVV